MNLRQYQQAALDSVYQHLRTRDDNPCVVIPTGGGKTPIIAQLCRDAVERWNGRVLVLAHVKELLEQSAETLRTIAPDLQVGVYSAGLGRRDTKHSVIVAGIQSIYKRACELDAFDLIIVDEAHLLPPDGEGMYQSVSVRSTDRQPQCSIDRIDGDALSTEVRNALCAGQPAQSHLFRDRRQRTDRPGLSFTTQNKVGSKEGRIRRVCIFALASSSAAKSRR